MNSRFEKLRKKLDKAVEVYGVNSKETKKIISIEDHNIIGGLGTAVCEVLSENFPAKVTRIGINDTFGESGKAEELLKKYNLNSEYLVKILSK